VTVVRFANGLEAWLKPTDFKNDEVVFTMYARGGASLAAPATFVEASLATAHASLSGAGGLRAIDLQRLLAGRLLSASPFISLSTHGIGGSSVPAQLETALQLLHLRVTAPGDDPDAFALLRRQLEAAVVNRTQDPMTLFGERVSEVNASGHYTAEPLTMERVGTLDRRTMVDFYRQRFANAADFTFFMVGAFSVDEAVPLLARYLGTLPSAGEAPSTHADLGIRFPDGIVRDTVVAGREPRSQTALSFFAEPSIEPSEQQAVSAATTVLSIALRDILREELGQTYGVSVGLVQRLPQRGSGHVAVRFGSDPGNVESMVGRVLQEVQRLRQEGPGGDLTMRAKETARRNLEVAVRQNGYWLGQLQSAHLFGRDPLEILERAASHRGGDREGRAAGVHAVLPARPLHGRDAAAGGAACRRHGRRRRAVTTEGGWVVLRACASMHEAIVLRSVLEGAGIDCVLPDEHSLGVHPGLTFMAGGVRLLVREDDLERAEDVLDEIDEADGG
jgi:zinc protease